MVLTILLTPCFESSDTDTHFFYYQLRRHSILSSFEGVYKPVARPSSLLFQTARHGDVVLEPAPGRNLTKIEWVASSRKQLHSHIRIPTSRIRSMSTVSIETFRAVETTLLAAADWTQCIHDYQDARDRVESRSRPQKAPASRVSPW